MMAPPGRVPAEYVGRARALRQKISKASIGDADKTLRFIKPLAPRPGWPTPSTPDWLDIHALGYQAQKLPTRLAIVADVKNGRLKVGELRLRASRMRFPDWGQGNEPSIAILLKMVTSNPFHAEESILADCGLHALARRIERGRPNDEAAVLRDMKALADGFRSALLKGGEFAVSTPSGGQWLGSMTLVNGKSMMAVRTFVDG
jgi:hypothetical protein